MKASGFAHDNLSVIDNHCLKSRLGWFARNSRCMRLWNLYDISQVKLLNRSWNHGPPVPKSQSERTLWTGMVSQPIDGPLATALPGEGQGEGILLSKLSRHQ